MVTEVILDPSPSLQLPLTRFPSPSSPSTNPGGQYTVDSVVLKKLCRAIAALVNPTTLSGFAMIGRLNSLHLYKYSVANKFGVYCREHGKHTVMPEFRNYFQLFFELYSADN